ncbi:MAG: cysteine desulfurase [Actinomycetia bacterium]|nr:cysteine desulfurase [Actinomycetes bacterium]
MNGPAPVYLDYNATTPVDPAVVAAMGPYWTEQFFNPSSGYAEARAVREAVEAARTAVAALIGADPEGVVWTSGGTESDNWAIRGAWAYWSGRRTRVVISAIEHPAVAETAAALAAEGAEVVRLPVDATGVVRLDAAERLIDERTAVVSVMLANNEIGTIQPVAALARRARAVGAWVHTDAAQAVGKMPVDVDALGVDLLTVAGHKLYAPKGIGALYVRPGVPLGPWVRGGGQEGGRRSGTEPVPLIVGLGAAARLAQEWLAGPGPARQAALRDRLERRLLEAVEGARVFGREAPRLGNTLAWAAPGWTGAALLAACPGIRAGTGAACHGPAESPSATLEAMGVPREVARGLVRLSLGRSTSEDDVDRAAEALVLAVRRRT